MKILALIALASTLVAGAYPGWRVAATKGVSMRYPPGWYATKRSLTPVTWPSQVLAIASFRFPSEPRPNGCSPQGTLDRLPADGALLYVIEYGTRAPRPSVFPPKPSRPRLANFGNYECLGPSYLVRFRLAGRFFQIHVVLGSSAGPGMAATVRRILASFRARP